MRTHDLGALLGGDDSHEGLAKRVALLTEVVFDGEVRIFGRGEPTVWAKVPYGNLANARASLSLISSRVKAAEP